MNEIQTKPLPKILAVLACDDYGPAPGKFEGEPVFAPYFWGLGLEGFSDSDNNGVFTFKITKADSGNPFWPQIREWLGRKRTIRLREDDSGFVHCF